MNACRNDTGAALGHVNAMMQNLDEIHRIETHLEFARGIGRVSGPQVREALQATIDFQLRSQPTDELCDQTLSISQLTPFCDKTSSVSRAQRATLVAGHIQRRAMSALRPKSGHRSPEQSCQLCVGSRSGSLLSDSVGARQ